MPVYDSIGSDFPLALAPGWLNLGLWESRDGEPEVAEEACIRLVSTLAEALPQGGDILDVANGLAAQDVVFDRVLMPRSLTVVNITESQLRAGGGGGGGGRAGRPRPPPPTPCSPMRSHSRSTMSRSTELPASRPLSTSPPASASSERPSGSCAAGER